MGEPSSLCEDRSPGGEGAGFLRWPGTPGAADGQTRCPPGMQRHRAEHSWRANAPEKKKGRRVLGPSQRWGADLLFRTALMPAFAVDGHGYAERKGAVVSKNALAWPGPLQPTRGVESQTAWVWVNPLRRFPGAPARPSRNSLALNNPAKTRLLKAACGQAMEE